MDNRPSGSASAVAAPVPPSLRRVVRFGVSGAVATLIYFAVTSLLVLVMRLTPVVASVCAYLFSLGISYLLQSRFTFRATTDSVDQVTKFVVTSVVGLALSWSIMAITADVLSWPYFVGAGIVCVLIPLMNFFVFRGWVFATRKIAGGMPSRDS